MEGWGAEDADFFTEYTYISNGTNQTGLVSEIRYHTVYQQEDIIIDPFRYEWEVKTLRYTYDANGNITTVSEVEYDDEDVEVGENLLHTYTYDGLNQLIRHDDAEANKSYRYYYVKGVLRYTYVYPYSTGELGTAEELIPRFYLSNWSDQMTQFKDKPITYDEIGNVTSYNGYTYDWEKGRQLSSITGNGLDMSFEYNSSGLRTQKTVNGETKQYFYSGDLLVSEYDGIEYTNFTYSPSGEPVGFSFFDVESNEPLGYYLYLKNLQGDIIGLIDFKGEIECTYSYDAWGKFLGAYDKNGNEITHPNSAALSNPLRYRGYYYDDETGLYYLNSRYYNPEWGRFICADAITAVNSDLLATNIYAYCFNNPVNFDDKTGYYSGIDDAAAIIVGAISGVGGQLVSDLIRGKLSTDEYYLGSLVGGICGGWIALYYPTASAAVGAGISSLVTELALLHGGKSEKLIDEIIVDSLIDTANGFLLGKILDNLPITPHSYDIQYKKSLSNLSVGFNNATVKTFRDALYYGSIFESAGSILNKCVELFFDAMYFKP